VRVDAHIAIAVPGECLHCEGATRPRRGPNVT
jgi:hypothetical protein